MRRFFRSHRDEDYSQIQYLTAKCSRLAQEKAALEREWALSRERVRVLQVELDSVRSQLSQKDSTIQELLNKLQQQQQRSVSSSEAALLTFHLESMGSELQLLQSSEKQLLGLMDELHQEAHYAKRKAEDLETRFGQESHLNAKHRKELEYQLQGKLCEVQELQKAHHALQQELSEQHSTHQRTVQELQRENTNSVEKLKEMAEQVEWLCGQQRNWICCIKRFKDCLNDEKETLVLQVNRLQDELSEYKKNKKSELISEKDTHPTLHCIRWDVDGTSDLQVDEDEWRTKYRDLIHRHSSCQQLDDYEYLKPP